MLQAVITPEFTLKCTVSSCRGCAQPGLAPILDYGLMPPSDGFLSSPETNATRVHFPLELVFCEKCSLLQILETLEPQHLFGAGYLYLSSCSTSWLEHCRSNAEDIICRFDLDADNLVLEIASNDGYMLQYFKQHGIQVLGVEPAPAPFRHANTRGIETINEFFTPDLARSLAKEKKADIVVSNNVLAHVADIHDFIAGVKEVLSEKGTWIIEVPYVRALVDGCAFDTVYHEHLCYFSVSSLQSILSRHQLYLNDIKTLSSHGGSLRAYVGRRKNQTKRVSDMLHEEQHAGMRSLDYYLAFALRARSVNMQIVGVLEELAAQGRRIAAYGAAAKGTILLNCLGPTCCHVEYAADRNALKHGKWIPGVDIPIVPLTEIMRQRPDYLLLLPWNLRREVMLQERDYLQSGGSFIVPLPRPEVVSGNDL